MSMEIFSSLRSATIAGSLALLCLSVPSSAETVKVSVDQAKLMKLPEKISTIVVGNPLIADVTLQPGGMAVVTGKGYGSTNVLVLDKRGEVLLDSVITVEGPSDDVVTIYRGVERESYSCMPTCQRRVTLGDSEKYFTTAISQGSAVTDKATAAGKTGP